MKYGAILDLVGRTEDIRKEIEAERDRIEEGESNLEERLVSDVLPAERVAEVVSR